MNIGKVMGIQNVLSIKRNTLWEVKMRSTFMGISFLLFNKTLYNLNPRGYSYGIY